MNPLIEAAVDLQRLLDSWNWRFCVIGGIAVLRWGESRLTRDVDLALLTGFGNEDDYILPLLGAGYKGRIPDVVEFARRNRVLLLTGPTGIFIDVSLAALPFEAQAIERATPFEFAPGYSLRTCSAEDLIVFKLFAFRSLDLADAESVAARNGKTLDWTYVLKNLAPLAEAKNDPAIMAKAVWLQNKYGEADS